MDGISHLLAYRQQQFSFMECGREEGRGKRERKRERKGERKREIVLGVIW